MEKLLRPFVALKFQDYRLLWIGLFISRVAAEMQVVGMNWHVYVLTNSAISLGLIGLARFLPIIGFSLVGGIAADKFSRRNLMIWAHASMAIASLVLAAATIYHLVSPWLIYLTVAIISASTAFDLPARQAIMPSLVPKEYFTRAVSLNQLYFRTGLVVGPMFGGFAIAALGISSVYVISTLLFVSVILFMVLMQPGKHAEASNAAFSLSSLHEGIDFVRKTPMIWATMILDFIATFFSEGTILLPIFAKDIFRVGPQGLGFLYAAPSIGAISTTFIIHKIEKIPQQGKILLSSVLLYGFATLLFGLTKSFPLALGVLFFVGAGDAISAVIRNTIRQFATPDYLRGRMVSVNMIFFMGGPQLGELEAGITASLWGAPTAVVVGGLGTILATLTLAILVPKLRIYKL